MRGPTAERVSANIKDLRGKRDLDLAGLSERLRLLGHPLSVSGLSKIELGQRRVDVDDLIALAVALDVTPNRLLLPDSAEQKIVDLTPGRGFHESAIWWWAQGAEQLPSRQFPGAGVSDLDFARECRPHDPPDDARMSDVRAHQEDLAPVTRAVRTAQEKTGFRLATIINYIKLADTMRRAASQLGTRQESAHGKHQ